MRRRKGRIHKWMTIFAGGVSGVVFFAAVSVMAMEFGGFDVEIGTGEYQGDSFWEQGTSAPQNGNGQTYPDHMQEEPSPTEQNPEWKQGDFREDFWMEETPSYNGQVFPVPDYIQPLPSEQETLPAPAITQGSLPAPLAAATPTVVPTPTVIPTPSVTPTPTLTVTSTPTVTPSPTSSPKPYSTSAAEEPFRYYRRNVKNRNKMEVKVTELKFPVSAKVKRAEIRVRAKDWVQVLSLRVNNKEADWRWEKDVLVIEQEEIPEDSEIKILLATEENDGSHSVIAEYCEGDFCA